MNQSVEISVGARTWQIQPGDSFTFGRGATCTVCLDPTDLAISRLAGSVEWESGTWWLLNRSQTRPLQVVDEIGIRTVLAPGRQAAAVGHLTVIVEGQVRRHALTVDAPSPLAADTRLAPLSTLADSRPTMSVARVAISDSDRLAMVALFSGYLERFPRYEPHPKSYADAAARLQWPRTTLVKRIEHLRTRLTQAGVPNLLGDNALDALAEWALATGVITREHLDLLPPR